MLRAAIVVLTCLAALVPAVGQQPTEIPEEPQPMPAPALPYYDFKACPFEGCTYREWKARKAVTVYDTWKSNRRAIAKVSPGESVTGLNGVAITFKPGTIRMDRDLPNLKLKKGDTILTYTYVGESYSAVWFKGKFYPEFDISFTKWPDGSGCNGPSCAATYVELGEREWWAQIKLKSGRTGWVDMEEAEFDGVDALAKFTVGGQKWHSKSQTQHTKCASLPRVPTRLIRYQETRDLHFITFTCYHRRTYLAECSTRDLFEQMLEQTRRLYRFYISAYVVMPEHVHLLISEPERRLLSVAMQALKQSSHGATAISTPFWASPLL